MSNKDAKRKDKFTFLGKAGAYVFMYVSRDQPSFVVSETSTLQLMSMKFISNEEINLPHPFLLVTQDMTRKMLFNLGFKSGLLVCLVVNTVQH
jgi:hypothetical protein